ncbi:MAG: DUF5682 family protein [Solirubrobacteraceae bacterium]
METPLSAKGGLYRRAIRHAERAGHERIAVVCGAWHAPALRRDAFPPASRDDFVLRGLPKVKVASTWIPWTNDRLAFASGYGAGVTSPGWYQHLFTVPDEPVARWLARVASLLRAEGLDASPASVVEAVRLSEVLGAVRGRPCPGLPEVRDASLTVLCQGDELRLALIERRLVVGEVLGSIPDTTPMVPLAGDLSRLQRSLRLEATAVSVEREFDLRRPLDLERSRLLHRLRLLGVPWGTPIRTAGRTLGTFKESWRLAWRPELSVRLVEASRYGATVEAAADGFASARATASEQLPELTALVEVCLLAGINGALAVVIRALADRAARDADIGRLMDAVVPLGRVHRYGNVRGNDAQIVGLVLEGLLTRVCVGLSLTLRGLDDEAATELVKRIEGVAGAVLLLDHADLREQWTNALVAVSGDPDAHGLVAGRTTRLLLDGDVVDPAEAHRRMELELSRAADAERGAAWLEGFLTGTGLLLLHDQALLAVIDRWITLVSNGRFDDLLPVLRRTFAGFTTGERRQIGVAVRRSPSALAPSAGSSDRAGDEQGFNSELANAALATVMELLG